MFSGMGEFIGYVDTVSDAFILLEAATRGYIPTVKSRPDSKDRENILPGSTVIFDASTTGMTRWVDGKSWSPSRFRDGFFMYQEWPLTQGSLFKKAISIISPTGHRYHLINYFTQESMKDISRTPRAFTSLLPKSAELLAAAEDYRYFKCFRTRSQSWRKLFPAPKPSTKLELTKRPIMRRTPFSTKSPESHRLPSIQSLNLLQTTSLPLATIYAEDMRQLSLFSFPY
ncbi:Global transcription regulator sge1 [Entomophthora muscae]|uniref:Global transcription regulator sge1 n=1 Tax=Entomophthora muscae TaxID=34485 RepID=A0ACC2RL55_9FUNG|nr:Global transcription regulator sge1 [Entomophthora muscae]